jgi:PAS domain S-box-containing protein
VRVAEDTRTLCILDLEDDPLDTELVQANLAEGGITCEIVRVQTREEFVAALQGSDFDLIFSDYSLPSFDGLSALKLAKEIRPEVPFILVSGAIGEDRAIEALKSGATDYVLKQRLERLVPAVRRAVREAEERTERSRAEEALGRSEERYRTLVEQIPAITYVQEPVESSNPKAVTYMSPQYETVLGHPAQSEVIDEEHWYKTLHPEDRERVLAEDARTDETGEPFDVEYRIIAGNGRVVWVRDQATLVRDEEGRPLYWLGVQYDITEQKRAEETLRESEERYRAVIEQSAEGLYLLDAETKRVMETNSSLQRMLGYSAEELEGMVLYDLIELPREEVDATLRRTLERGYRPVGERRYRRKDGGLVDVEIGASVIRYGGGEVVCAVVRDVTERKRAEEAMREVREAERRRLARDLHDGVLQDLSYTTAAMGLIMLKAAGTSLEEELQKTIDALRRAAQGLRNAVNDLRLEEEQDRPFPELVEYLVQRNRTMVRGYEISLEVTEGFPFAPLGEVGTQMLRIIREALTNARRHSGALNVIVTLKVEEEDMVAEVSDDGRGLGPGAAPGVGLKSMRERAAILGGKLEIESAVGQGTRVRLRVPVLQKG